MESHATGGSASWIRRRPSLRRGGLTGPHASSDLRSVSRLVASGTGILSIAAGVLHLSAAADHTNLPVMMAGFIVVGTLQVALGGLLFARRPGRLVLGAAITLMLGAVATWVVSRTAGLPFLPGGHMEPIGWKDSATNLFEIGSVAGLLLMMSSELDRVVLPTARLGNQALGGLATGVFVLFAPGLLLAGGEHHSAGQMAHRHGKETASHDDGGKGQGHGGDGHAASEKGGRDDGHPHGGGSSSGSSGDGHDDHGGGGELASAGSSHGHNGDSAGGGGSGGGHPDSGHNRSGGGSHSDRGSGGGRRGDNRSEGHGRNEGHRRGDDHPDGGSPGHGDEHGSRDDAHAAGHRWADHGAGNHGTPGPGLVPSSCERTSRGYTCRMGPFDIDRGETMQMVTPVAAPSEAGYLTSGDATLVDANDKPIPRESVHLHHAVWLNPTRSEMTCRRYDGWFPASERFFGTGKERTKLQLPAGYGYYWSNNLPQRATQSAPFWYVNVMLDGSHGGAVSYVKFDMDFVPEARGKNLTKVKPVWLDVRNCSSNPVFDVAKGSGENGVYRERWSYTMPRGGRFIGLAGHLHDGGLAVALGNATSGRHLYTSRPTYDKTGGRWTLTGMSSFYDTPGLRVNRGDRLQLTAAYDSTSAHHDVMGIMFGGLVPDAR